MRHVAGSSGRSVEELTTSVPSLPVAFSPLGLKYLEEHELRRRFDSYDTDGDGVINAHEARAMLRDAGAEGSLAEAEQAVAAFGVAGGAQGAISWEELKRAVDVAATPVDGRVRPIYATLTLLFTSQGTQFPVLPQLARSLELSAADVGPAHPNPTLTLTLRIPLPVPLPLPHARWGCSRRARRSQGWRATCPPRSSPSGWAGGRCSSQDPR